MKLFKFFSGQSVQVLVYLCVLILPNLILPFTERLGFWGRATMLLLPLSLYLLVFSLRQKPSKLLLLCFPVLFLDAFQIVLTYLYGCGPIAVDMWLNLLTTNVNEASELLARLLPSVIFVIVVYVPVIVFAIVHVRKEKPVSVKLRKTARRVGVASLCVAAMSLILAYNTDDDYSVCNDLFPLNAVYNAGLSVERTSQSAKYGRNVQNFTYKARSLRPDTMRQAVVFVIGETSRAESWQLCGYTRPTNPLLSRVKDLVVYKHYMSQSNTTHKSVPILLSPAEARNYADLNKVKSMFEAFREAGFRTYFISNQMRNRSYIEFFGNQADTCIYIKDSLGSNPQDVELVPYLRRTLAASDKRVMVVLHAYGSHFNYNDRYSDGQRRFRPDYIQNVNSKSLPIMLNAYDNSIVETDMFLAQTISALGKSHRVGAWLYTSDHGEDLLDDKRNRFMHASPTPSFYQLHVPLLVWLTPNYVAHYSEVARQLRAHKDLVASSDCVFHTVLELGGVATPWLNSSKSVVSKNYRELAPVYLTDHNKAVPLKKCFDEEDLAQMRLKHIRYE